MFDYPAHAICLSYDLRLIAPDIFFNLGIALAYFVIPFGLYRLLRSSGKFLIPIRSVLWMFVIFILACGTSHISRTLTTLYGGGFYVLDLVVCAITFAASIITALLLLRNGKSLLDLVRHMLELGA